MEWTGWYFNFVVSSSYKVGKLNTSILQKKWKKYQDDAERNEEDGQPKGLVSFLLLLEPCLASSDCYLILT